MKKGLKLITITLFLVTLTLNMGIVSAGQEVTIKLYFLKDLVGSNFPETIAITRKLSATNSTLSSAFVELFKGPSEAEKQRKLYVPFEPKDVADYNTSCQKKRDKKQLKPLGNYFIKAAIKDGVAIIDFKPDAMCYLQNTPANSYRVMEPIQKTATEFQDVKSVEYSINGKVITEWDG